MEDITRTLKLLTDNINQAKENEASGSTSFLRQDLNMANLLAEHLARQIVAKEMEVEAGLQKGFGVDVDAMPTIHNPAVIA